MNSCSYGISFDKKKKKKVYFSHLSPAISSRDWTPCIYLDSRVLLECIFLDVLFYLGSDEKLPKVLMLNSLFSYALPLSPSHCFSIVFFFFLISHTSFSLIWVNYLLLCMYLVRTIALVHLSHVSGQVRHITIYI